MKVSNPPGLKSGVVLTSRLNSAASANVSYTGAGFKPRIIFFLAEIPSAPSMSIGIAVEGGFNSCIVQNQSGNMSSRSAHCIDSEETGGRQEASVASFDADGFTLTWTKVTTPTSTTEIIALCVR